jgi:hypothetical protein
MSTMKEPLQLQILKEKLLLYELYDDFSMAKPECYTFETLSKVLTYMYEMYQYHAYLQELHPGMAIPIKIKETFYSDNIDFTVTIVDSADKELQQLNKCVAIIVNKTYNHTFNDTNGNDFVVYDICLNNTCDSPLENITFNKVHLTKLGEFLATLDNIKALDVLPYHDMGIVKYESLKKEYPLKGTPALNKQQAMEARDVILDSMKKTRIALNQQNESN